jgi:hypothetical protein
MYSSFFISVPTSICAFTLLSASALLVVGGYEVFLLKVAARWFLSEI